MKNQINFPNVLILIRLLIVPIIIILLLLPISLENPHWIYREGSDYGMLLTDLIAGILFMIASFTDWLDGWWARRNNQITKFGKLFDPLADKILVNTVLIIFASRGIIPMPFVLVFVIRDILVDGLRMMLASDGIVLSADRFGKLKTLFQMIGLTLLFFIHPIYKVGTNESYFHFFEWQGISVVMNIPLMFGLFFSVLSGFNYYKKAYIGYKNK